MYFANLWGLLGLMALPVIVVIHLYHRRYPTLFVAGLHLWGVETHTTTAGRTREQLPITASLICELLAALLLSLVLADPRWGQLGRVVHLVAVLDNSASMTSRPPGEKPFRDIAVEELERRIASLPRGSVVTLLRTGRRPEMLAGPAVSWDDAKQKLADWKPALPKHDFLPTWDLAAQLAEGTGELLFLTDSVPGKEVAVPKTMEIISVGSALENVSISAARWDFDSQAAKGRVFVRLTNHGKRPTNVRIAGLVGSVEDAKPIATTTSKVANAKPETDQQLPESASQKKLFENEVSLDAGASAPLEIEVSGGLGRMIVECESIGDGLSLDNRVELIEPKVRVLHVTVALAKETAAEQAVVRVLKTLPDLSLTESETAELIIAPSDPLPPSQRELWWLGIGPLDPSEEARKAAIDLVGPYVLEKQNPLLDGLTLGGVVWGGAQPVKLEVSPIITAGSMPLLSRLTGTRTTAYLLNIDFARTNLGDSPDWPILLSNLIELRRDNLPGLRRWNYRLNEEIRFRIADVLNPSTTAQDQSATPALASNDNLADSNPLELVHRGTKRPLARASMVEIPPLDDAGVYSVLDGKRLIGEFAVAFFDQEESNLSDLRPGRRDAETPPNSEVGFLLDQPLTWLVLVGILLIAAVAFADWSVLSEGRRRRD